MAINANQALPVTKIVTLDVERRSVSPLTLRLGEGDSRRLVFRLSKEGRLWETSGAEAALVAEKEDGALIAVPLAPVETGLAATLPAEITADSGTLLCEIRVAQGSSVLITPSFLLEVEKSVSGGEATVFTDGEGVEF